MNIKKIKINNFGKLQDKEVSFDKGINVIYGKNEAGKSTMLKFICGILYGLSKNKNGEVISEFDKYKPWNASSFSGKIEYELDDGYIYDVFRDFNKKSPSIFREGEDISKSFKKSRTNGIEFFQEQTLVDKDLYINTAIMEQEKVRLKDNSRNDVINRITNLVTTGSDTVSYKDAITKIKSEQLEKIGTDRTVQKPINKINSQIEYLTKEKEKLQKYKNNYINTEKTRDELNKQLEEEKKKLKLLKIEKDNIDNNQIIESEIELLKHSKNEIDSKIKQLNNNTSEEKYKQLLKERKNTIVPIIFGLLSIACISLSWTFFKNAITNIVLSTILLLVIVLAIKEIIKQKKISKQIDDHKKINDSISNEINVLKGNYNDLNDRYKEKIVQLDGIIDNQYNQLLDLCNSQDETEYIDNIYKFSTNELLEQLDNKSNNIYETDVKLRLLNQDIENSNIKLEQLIQIEEELQFLEKEKKKLEELNNLYEITKECIEEAYVETKNNLSPRYKENLSSIVSDITNNKYSRVEVNDENILIETELGELLPINVLSTGTIDQIYLALRLSAFNEVTKESLPIFFDEAFAYFDDNRLEKILRYLNNEYNNTQIFIFTCSKREMEILEEQKIDYNVVYFE